jgi:hydrogenase maturation protease
MAKVLVIACGNPLRCDDGLAWVAAEELKTVAFLDPPAIHACFQLTPELACQVSSASTVIFLDASRTGEPGSLSSIEVLPKQGPRVFTHDCSPAFVLALSQQLYGKLPSRSVCVAMSGECFDHGDQLSARISESLPSLIAELRQIIADEATR